MPLLASPDRAAVDRPRRHRQSSRFSFQHALIREVSYQQLTRESATGPAPTGRRNDRTCTRGRSPARTSPRWLITGLTPEVPDATISYSDPGGVAGARGRRVRRGGTAARAPACATGTGDGGSRSKPPTRFAGIVRWRTRATAWDSSSRAARRRIRPCGSLGLARPHSSRRCSSPRRRSFLPTGRFASAVSATAAVDSGTTLDVARAFRHSAEVCYFNNDMLGMICDSISAVTYAVIGAALGGAGRRVNRAGRAFSASPACGASASGSFIAPSPWPRPPTISAAQAYAHMVSCLYYVGLGDWPLGGAQRAALSGAVRADGRPRQLDQRAGGAILDEPLPFARWRAYDAARRLRDRRGRNRQSPASGLGVSLPGGLRAQTQRAGRGGDPAAGGTRLPRRDRRRERAHSDARHARARTAAKRRGLAGPSHRERGPGADRQRDASDRPGHARGLFVARDGGSRRLAGGAFPRLATRTS